MSNILIVLESESLENLAKKADRILEQRNEAPGSVAAISEEGLSSSSSLPPTAFSVGEIHAVRQFMCSRESRDGRESRGQGAGSGSQSNICRNHAKWGTKSFSCRPGCLFGDL